MPRTRQIRPGFFKNELLCELPDRVRLLFAGVWTLADREGRLLDRPKLIKSELFPYDSFDVNRGLGQLADRGFLVRYERCGKQCIQVVNWHKHQHPHPREEASSLPPPDGFRPATGADPGLTTGATPEPDPGAPPARLVASSSSSSLPSSNSLREKTPNPGADAPGPGGVAPHPRANGTNARAVGTNPRAKNTNPRATGTNPRARGRIDWSDESTPRYEQRTNADGKREWVLVEAEA